MSKDPLELTISMKDKVVVIRQSVLKALGNPSYIKLIKAPDFSKLYVSALQKEEQDSIHLPSSVYSNEDGIALSADQYIHNLAKKHGWIDEAAHLFVGSCRATPQNGVR